MKKNQVVKNNVELRYITLFLFTLSVVVSSLFLSINKLQPLLFQQIFVSCTAAYEKITGNSLIISTALVVGLLAVFVSLTLKLVLSGYRTSKSLAHFEGGAQKKFPSSVRKAAFKLKLNHQDIIITNHLSPLAITAGLLSPKIVFSKGLIRQLSEKELEAVLLHEMYHQQHKHGMLFVAAQAVASALALFVPVLKDVITNMKVDFENAADLYAVSYQGSTRHIASALKKLSGAGSAAYFPAFASITDDRLAILGHSKSVTPAFNTTKLFFSICTVMFLTFFATMPVDASKAVVANQSADNCEAEMNCANGCVKRFTIGMSKRQNSSSILPASVF